MDIQTSMDENQYNDTNENPQFSTQYPNFDDQFPVSNTPLEPNSKRLRGGNFTVEEDLLIVSAWLNVSLDALHGNEHKQKAFWTRLWEYFHKYKKFASTRTQVSLMNRWSTIQLATNKFCGCYAQIESRNQSGVNEQDKPKWLEDCQNKKSIRNKTVSSSSDFTFGNTQETHVDLPNSNSVDLERPPGRKAEKDRKKMKDKDTRNDSSSACVTLLQAMREEKKQFNEKKIEMFERQYAQEQERLAYEQEKLRLEQMKEDERIMMIDTTGMPQMLADFYMQRQKEILAKRTVGR
ncbi:unnamed protein product [Fraxinus pennsylvanica]|uniref:No apical meristem-associated C-terminal domain-containing protein n=1 Tax=Fraxinus pennsylvanica TaxID=56036 RepID=A0AAD2ACL4_9LAMI|nr:unnamed protein product [Fraxinus pennsylvanica]